MNERNSEDWIIQYVFIFGIVILWVFILLSYSTDQISDEVANPLSIIDLSTDDITYNQVLNSMTNKTSTRGVFASEYDGETISWNAHISGYYSQITGIKFCVIDKDHQNVVYNEPCDWFWAISSDYEVMNADNFEVNPDWDGYWVRYILNYFDVPFNENEVYYDYIYTITGIVDNLDCGVAEHCVPNVEIKSIEKRDYDFSSNIDGTKEVFVRNDGDVRPEWAMVDGRGAYFNEIRIKDNTTSSDHLVLKSDFIDGIVNVNSELEPLDNLITNINNPVFSLDDKYVYFKAQGWVTSDSVFSINLETKEIKFISDGNYLDIVKAGKYKGNLILLKHKYIPLKDVPSINYSHAYDKYFIINPETGEEIKDLGYWGYWDDRDEHPDGITTFDIRDVDLYEEFDMIDNCLGLKARLGDIFYVDVNLDGKEEVIVHVESCGSAGTLFYGIYGLDDNNSLFKINTDIITGKYVTYSVGANFLVEYIPVGYSEIGFNFPASEIYNYYNWNQDVGGFELIDTK